MKKITFILPNISKYPTGGALVVYRYAVALRERGWDVCVVHPILLRVIDERWNWYTRVFVKFRQTIKLFVRRGDVGATHPAWVENKNFKSIVVPYISNGFIDDSDYIVATYWKTAQEVYNLNPHKGKKIYFIQGYETWSGGVSQVKSTWRLKMKPIVISTWLAKMYRDATSCTPSIVFNSYNENAYYKTADYIKRDECVSALYNSAPGKGGRDVIKIMCELKNINTNVAGIIFGVEDRPDFIPKWIIYYKMPTSTEIREAVYNKSRVFLCTSISEGWGLTSAEATACGTPVVTYSNGGSDDIVENNSTGYIVNCGDIGAAVNCINKILHNIADGERMSELCLEKSKLWRMNISVDALERAIEK